MKTFSFLIILSIAIGSCQKNKATGFLSNETVSENNQKKDSAVVTYYRCPTSGLRNPPTYIGNLAGSYNAIYWGYNSGVNSYLFNNGSNTTVLVSPNGIYTLVFQSDGNLVLYKYYQTNYQYSLWSSGTYNTPAKCLAFQIDGNIVLYNSSKTIAYWSTGTTNGQSIINLSAVFAIQDDGNLVNYQAIGTLSNYYCFWASDTQNSNTSCHH